LTKISLRQYGFSLIELAIGLAISSIVAAAATSVFSPLLRTIKQTDDIATLNSGTAHVDDYLRTLTRNLGGGALHPGDLITVLNGADATGTVRADRLIIARALGSGVYASAASGSGASLTLSFSAVTAEAGGPQCPLTSVPMVSAQPSYDEAITFFGIGTPVLVLSPDRAAIYRGTSALTIDSVESSATFQDCSYTVALDALYAHASIAPTSTLALFPLRIERIGLADHALPAPLKIDVFSAAQFDVGSATTLSESATELWPAVFDFQAQLGFDLPPGDGLIASEEWAFKGTQTCPAWPTCLPAMVGGATTRHLRAFRFGVLLGALRRTPDHNGSAQHLFNELPVSSSSYVQRAVTGQVTLRNGAQP
jgi:prepilin-type N-terminal cleavage/methylation domain-containing protein